MYDSRTLTPKPCLMCKAIFTPIRHNHTFCAECGAFRNRALASSKTSKLFDAGKIEEIKELFVAMDSKREERARQAEQRKVLRQENNASECPERRDAGIEGLARALNVLPAPASASAPRISSFGKPAMIASMTCECSRKITLGYPCRCAKS